jgi:hypothetical protein
MHINVFNPQKKVPFTLTSTWAIHIGKHPLRRIMVRLKRTEIEKLFEKVRELEKKADLQMTAMPPEAPTGGKNSTTSKKGGKSS